MPKVYIAGPLFNKHEQKYLEEIADILQSNGYDCFLPHRDLPVDPEVLEGVDMAQETKDFIFQTDSDALEKADILVALIDAVIQLSLNRLLTTFEADNVVR